MNSQSLPIASLSSASACELADLGALRQDLSFCVSCCDRAVQALTSDPQDLTAARAFWTAALISYARCFAHGVRYGLSPDIYSHFEGEPAAAHKYYIDLRSKHVAHSVNPFEQIVVGAVLAPPDSAERIVEGIATLVASQVAESAETIAQLSVLARTAIAHVSRRGKELEVAVLAEAKALPIGSLYDRATPRVTVPSPSTVSQRR